MLTRLRRLAILALLITALLGGLIGGAPAATAQDIAQDTAQNETPEPSFDAGVVNIVEVSGYLDAVLVDFIHQELDLAEAQGARSVVLQLNSPGALVDDETFAKLTDRIAEMTIPFNVWVGPSGAKAKGRSAQLLGLADEVGIANGSPFGDLGPSVLDDAEVSAEYKAVEAGLRNNTQEFIDEGDDVEYGFGRLAPTIIFFLLDLPEFESSIDDSGEQPVRVPETQARFGALSVFKQQVHNLGSPPVAYLLFLLGIALLIFELFTAGVGVAGIIGAGAFIGGCYGLDVLPARWWAVAMLVLAMVAFAIDVQTGVPRFWTAVGTVLLVIGSIFLYDGVSIGWVALLTGLIGILLAMINGMPSMVRTRFSTPTIGRTNLLGQLGDVVEAVNPDGVVMIDGARWRARTNRATPVDVGERARVIEIDGLILEVEPEAGAARDYRERGPKEDGEVAETDQTETVES